MVTPARLRRSSFSSNSSNNGGIWKLISTSQVRIRSTMVLHLVKNTLQRNKLWKTTQEPPVWRLFVVFSGVEHALESVRKWTTPIMVELTRTRTGSRSPVTRAIG